MACDNYMWFTAAATGGLLSTAATQPKGETQDVFFKTKFAMELTSCSFSVAQAETTGSMSTGSSAGKAKFERLTIEKYVDAASVPLVNACTAGAHFPAIHIACRKAGGDQLKYLQFIMRQVFVTKVSWSGGGGEEAPKETIEFVFGAMGMQYCRQLETGAAGTPIQAMWSVITGKPNLGIPDPGSEKFDTP
jgi:type VI secretion system secreted protein Hcp